MKKRLTTFATIGLGLVLVFASGNAVQAYPGKTVELVKSVSTQSYPGKTVELSSGDFSTLSYPGKTVELE